MTKENFITTANSIGEQAQAKGLTYSMNNIYEDEYTNFTLSLDEDQKAVVYYDWDALGRLLREASNYVQNFSLTDEIQKSKDKTTRLEAKNKELEKNQKREF